MAQLQVELEVAAADLDAVEAALDRFGAVAQTYRCSDGTVLLEPGVGEHPLWQQVHVAALFPAETTDPDALYRGLSAQLGERLSAWRSAPLVERLWEREWLAHFRPMAFGRRLWIVPSGTQAGEPLPEDAVTVDLDPGLAFGTGTHETTALCLEWLDAEPLDGRCGIDYGTGSGVLAIAAVRLGASECLAIDNDPQAVTATRANAARNGVSAQVRAYPVAQRPDYCADFVVANILASTLIELAEELLAAVRRGGRLALSGLLDGQHGAVIDAFSGRVEWESPRIRGDWVLICGTRRQ